MALTRLGSLAISSLPAVSGANLTNLPAANLTGTLPAISGANLTGISAGITEADQWRLSSNFTGDADPIASNLERVDTSGWGKLGTGMSQSSGIFTFPSTGIWKVEFNAQAYYNGQNRYITAKIQGTTNNSSYTDLAKSDSGAENSSGSNIYHFSYTQTLVDCTDTSQVKVKFMINNEDDSTNVQGDSLSNRTYMNFIRLGDT